MEYCGKCGAPLNGETVCPNCGASKETSKGKTAAKKKAAPWTKFRLVLLAAIVVLLLLNFKYAAHKPCAWCGKEPSVAYRVSDGYSYVCRNCSSKCFICGKKATKHYENLLGEMVFVCQKCYD